MHRSAIFKAISKASHIWYVVLDDIAASSSVSHRNGTEMTGTIIGGVICDEYAAEVAC